MKLEIAYHRKVSVFQSYDLISRQILNRKIGIQIMVSLLLHYNFYIYKSYNINSLETITNIYEK